MKSLAGSIFGCGIVLSILGFIANSELVIAGCILVGSAVIAVAIERRP